MLGLTTRARADTTHDKVGVQDASFVPFIVKLDGLSPAHCSASCRCRLCGTTPTEFPASLYFFREAESTCPVSRVTVKCTGSNVWGQVHEFATCVLLIVGPRPLTLWKDFPRLRLWPIRLSDSRSVCEC